MTLIALFFLSRRRLLYKYLGLALLALFSHPQVMSYDYPWTCPPNPSSNLRTVLSYISASEQCDDKKLADSLDQTLEHSILPQSLQRPQILSKNLYLEYFRAFTKMFQKPMRVRVLLDLVRFDDLHFTSSATFTKLSRWAIIS